ATHPAVMSLRRGINVDSKVVRCAGGVTMFRAFLIKTAVASALVLGLSGGTLAQQTSDATQDAKKAGSKAKDAAKDSGEAVKDAGKAAGKATTEAAKKTGQVTKDA